MDTALIYNPIVTPAVLATIASLALLVALWLARRSIVAMAGQVRQRIFTRTGFFWLVNIVFMAVSVLHAGVFFGITGGDVLAQLLGFAVSFFLDLVTVILMQAMLESKYRGEDGRARQFLFFICVTCGTSTFANLAISLNDFDGSKMLPNAGWLVQDAAPYVLASFPLFVIMMSIAAEMIINLRPLEQLKEEEYEEEQRKRVRLLQIRNDSLEQEAIEKQRLLQIHAAMKANKEQYKSSFSMPFLALFAPKAIDVEALMASKTEQLEEHYNEIIGALQEQIHALQNAPITMPDMALRVFPCPPDIQDEQGVNERSNEQSIAPISLESRRNKEEQNEQRGTEDFAPRSTPKRSKGDNALLQRAKEIIAHNPEITHEQLGALLQKSRSHAGKLKSRITKEQSTTA